MGRERALVIGGTGPTGIWIVQGLVDRGHDVTMLHRGTHEVPETPASVEHLHADPFDEDALRGALSGRTFDVVVATYGRLRRVAEVTRGVTGRFVSVGGAPAHRGWMHPLVYEPPGVPVPIGEDGPLVADPSEDEKGYRVARTEEAVFEAHPDAAHVRYPMVYGPYQLKPREWLVVRRVLDGRARMVIPDDGLTLHHHGYSQNLAHAVLLAVDQPDAAAGQVFNAGDEEVLTIRQVAEVCAAALGGGLELVSMPYDLAPPARALLEQPLPTHRVLDLTRIKAVLGYRDVVPAREAVARTARWLAEHPLEPGGAGEQALGDPFDYAAEDALMDAWSAVRGGFPQIAFDPEPTYGFVYSGPGGRARSSATFD